MCRVHDFDLLTEEQLRELHKYPKLPVETLQLPTRHDPPAGYDRAKVVAWYEECRRFWSDPRTEGQKFFPEK